MTERPAEPEANNMTDEGPPEDLSTSNDEIKAAARGSEDEPDPESRAVDAPVRANRSLYVPARLHVFRISSTAHFPSKFSKGTPRDHRDHRSCVAFLFS